MSQLRMENEFLKGTRPPQTRAQEGAQSGRVHLGAYRGCVTWAAGYRFTDPLVDLRADASQAERLRTELLRELSAGHVLHGLDLRVIAQAPPQEEVIVETGDDTVALVHLTWSGHAEAPPWPTTKLLDSPEHLEDTIESRY